MPWYLFDPIDTFPHNTIDPNNYTLVGSIAPSCPSPNLHLCAVQASNNAGKPIFTLPLAGEMASALNNNIDYPNALLRPTLYP